MCQQGRTNAHVGAQVIRRQVGAPSVQFWPVILSNFTPVLTPAGTIHSEFPLVLRQHHLDGGFSKPGHRPALRRSLTSCTTASRPAKLTRDLSAAATPRCGVVRQRYPRGSMAPAFGHIRSRIRSCGMSPRSTIRLQMNVAEFPRGKCYVLVMVLAPHLAQVPLVADNDDGWWAH